MTIGQYRRKERWMRSLETVYNVAASEGFDWYAEGGACPARLVSEYDFTFYIRPRMRFAQRVSNHAIARGRGRYYGWMWAAEQFDKAAREEWVATQVALGMSQLVSFLGQAA